MGSLKILLSALAISGLSAQATAADLLAPPPPMPADGSAVAELGTGWYLRGDVGYVDYAKPKEGLGYSVGLPFDSIKLEDTWSLGGGFGYRFNNWFRADVTADYRSDARITALSSGSNYIHGFSTDALKFESTTVLLNGYIDLGNWSGVTPYVGAGIGYAHNNLSSYSSQITCLTPVCSAAFSQARVAHESGSKNNLALGVDGRCGRRHRRRPQARSRLSLCPDRQEQDRARFRRLRVQDQAARRARGAHRRTLHDRLIVSRQRVATRRAMTPPSSFW
jgi:opacity protein-like surface antigen